MWIALALFAPIIWAYSVPGLIKLRHMRRQLRLLDHCRELFILAEQSILDGERTTASAMLARISNNEARWRLGNHAAFRAALAVTAIAAGLIGYAVLRIILLDPSAPGIWSLQDFGNRLSTSSSLAFPLAMFASIWAVGSYFGEWSHHGQIENWAGRLRQMVGAGSSVGPAASAPSAVRVEPLTAWQWFGVEPYCSKTQLDRARRRLAQRYHPDRWVNASSAEQRAAGDAMKRVNAMYDELKAQIS